MARERFLADLHHSEALQNLDVAGDRAAVSLQLLRQVADRGGCFFHLFEQEYALLRQNVKKRLDIIEGDYSALWNRAAAIRQFRELASAFEERVYRFHPNLSLSHVSP